jgi:hypothetical protein
VNSMAEKLNGAVENCAKLLWRNGLRTRTSRKAHHGACGIQI